MSHYEQLLDKWHGILAIGYFDELREELGLGWANGAKVDIIALMADLHLRMARFKAKEEYTDEQANPGSNQDAMGFMKGDDK